MQGGLRIWAVPVLVVGLWVVPGSSAVAQTCAGGVENDFDGDGVSDVAIADPDATVGTHPRAGRVHVVYGGGGSQTISQADAFVAGGPEDGDRFGFSMDSVDWDGDGCTDLVVGVPFEAEGEDVESGWIDILYGSPTGFGPGGDLKLSQNSSGMPGGREAGDRFGYGLAAGETTVGDPYLVIGSPGESVGSTEGAGAFHYVRGSAMEMVHQDKAGVEGAVEAGDQYGLTVAASARHVAVAGPAEAAGASGYSGSVNVFTHDVTAGTIDDWAQDLPGDGEQEAGDWCGRSLAMVDYIPPGGSASDAGTLLAVGCPGEAIGLTADAGRVVLLRVADDTVSFLDSAGQSTTGVDGDPEAADYFGWSVAVVNRSPASAVAWPDLLVAAGAPGETSQGVAGAGAGQVFSAVGLPGDHDVWADTAGLAGAGWQREVDARFGQHVSASASHLFLSDPYGSSPAVYAVPWANLVDGASDPVRVYEPGSDGLPASGVGAFGAVVLGADAPAASAPATVNVADYQTDGRTNVEAIEAATEAAAPGDTVFFPGGTYLLDRAFHFGSDRNYVGDPDDPPVLVGTTSTSLLLQHSASEPLHDVTIRGLHFDNVEIQLSGDSSY